MITSVSPRATRRSMPRKISCRPIRLASERTSIIDEAVAWRAAVGAGGTRVAIVPEVFTVDEQGLGVAWLFGTPCAEPSTPFALRCRGFAHAGRGHGLASPRAAHVA